MSIHIRSTSLSHQQLRSCEYSFFFKDESLRIPYNLYNLATFWMLRLMAVTGVKTSRSSWSLFERPFGLEIAETAVSSIKSFKRKGGLLVGMQYCDTKKHTPKSIASPGEVGT